MEGQTTVTRLLEALQQGDDAALEDLFAHVYTELKRLAQQHRRYWHGNNTLNTTAIVHEAYLKLVGPEQIEVESRGHFFALAAKAMRQILCNYARKRSAQKRGGDRERLSLEALEAGSDHLILTDEQADTIAALDAALERLDKIDPRQCKVVECRFFGGLTVEETAAVLGISSRTVKRDWAVAQAWLHREMEEAYD